MVIMRHTISSEHLDYFQKLNLIEFEELLTEDQLKKLDGAIDAALLQRLNISPTLMERQTATQLFTAGRDLWRSHEAIRKIVTAPRLAKIASELTRKRIVRLGYDQFFPYVKPFSNLIAAGPYVDLLNQTTTIGAVSSLQGITCGVMLCLQCGEEIERAVGSDIFATTPGHGVFFNTEALIDFSQLFQRPNAKYLMLVFTQQAAVYLFNKNDPNNSSLRQIGYSYSDKLKDKLNPILYRA
jgi:hypothetical protein